jgi:hypothetical protein
MRARSYSSAPPFPWGTLALLFVYMSTLTLIA